MHSGTCVAFHFRFAAEQEQRVFVCFLNRVFELVNRHERAYTLYVIHMRRNQDFVQTFSLPRILDTCYITCLGLQRTCPRWRLRARRLTAGGCCHMLASQPGGGPGTLTVGLRLGQSLTRSASTVDCLPAQCAVGLESSTLRHQSGRPCKISSRMY